MQEVRDRARLVDASEIGAPEIRATVPRAEIEELLKSKDGEPELVIDVAGGPEPQAHTFRLAWEPGKLEELLGKADGDSITLAFDGSELEQALERDVEAHGMREAAVVLAVAATTAAAGAGFARADAAPAAQASGGASATAAASAKTGPAVSEREWPQLVKSSPAAGTSEREWPQLVGGTAAESPAPATTAPVVSEREWPQVVHPSTATGVSEREWPEVVGGNATQSPSTVSASTDTSGGLDAATAGAVAGGAALLITAAGFAMRRRGDIEPRPA